MKRKDYSNKAAQIAIFTILLAAAVTLLNSCGPKGANPSALASLTRSDNPDVAPVNPNTQTGGLTSNGRPYFTISPDSEVEQMRNAVEITEPNRDFAKQFVDVSVKTDSNGELNLKVQRAGQAQDLVFKGPLAQLQDKFVGSYADSTGQRPDLTLDISCEEKECFHAEVLLKDQQGHKAAMIPTREIGAAHVYVPSDEKREDLEKSGFLPYGDDVPVEVSTTEVFPGETHITVRNKNDGQVLFKSELHATGDDDTSNQPEEVTAEVGENKNSNVTAQVEGFNKEDRQIIYKVSRTPDPKKPKETQVVYYEVNLPRSPSVKVDVPRQCPVTPKGKVHPLVKKILEEDCGNPLLENDMKRWKNKSSSDATKLLALYAQSKNPSATGVPLDFKIVAEELRNNDLPMIFTAQAMEESGFNKNIVSKSIYHERGLWQLLPATARDLLHISAEDCFNPKIETNAAAKLINDLRKKFKDNVKLTLAGYNGGEKWVTQFAQEHAYTLDLYRICHITPNQSFQNGPCGYVPKILSLMITSLDPGAFGVANIDAMEAE